MFGRERVGDKCLYVKLLNFAERMSNKVTSISSIKDFKRKETLKKRNWKKHDDDFFSMMLKSQLHVDVICEYDFHPTRNWRFDYAIIDYKIAIEQDGGVWTGGRHTNPIGYQKDLEKFNEAAAMGWLILKFTPDQMMKTSTLDLIAKTVQYRKTQLTQSSSTRFNEAKRKNEEREKPKNKEDQNVSE